MSARRLLCRFKRNDNRYIPINVVHYEDNPLLNVDLKLLEDQTLSKNNNDSSSININLLPAANTLNNSLQNDVDNSLATQISVTSNNVEETLKNILVYPEIKKLAKRKNKNKIQLPSVITNDCWLGLKKNKMIENDYC